MNPSEGPLAGGEIFFHFSVVSDTTDHLTRRGVMRTELEARRKDCEDLVSYTWVC